jgi:hypothetical protein
MLLDGYQKEKSYHRIAFVWQKIYCYCIALSHLVSADKQQASHENVMGCCTRQNKPQGYLSQSGRDNHFQN